MTFSQPSIADDVKDIIDKQLKLSEHGHDFGLEDDLWTLGMTSLNSVGVMLAIEDAFDIEFPESLLNEATFRSANSIAAAVERTREEGGRASF
jgi:acyl carrier protein